MKNFNAWIQKSPEWKEWTVFIFALLGVEVALTLLLQPYSSIEKVLPEAQLFRFFLPLLVLIEVIFEEFIFRYLPIKLVRNKVGWNSKLALTVLATSFIFWLYHRDFRFVSFVYLFIGGLLSSLIFIKCGTYEKNYRFAMMSSSLHHLLLNLWGLYLK